jgi:hypothetical protein
MQLVSTTAGIALHVLRQCCHEVQQNGPWHWQCSMRIGRALSIEASLGDGFLNLSCRPEGIGARSHALEQALRANRTLRGGVKLALGSSDCDLHLRADLPVVDEKRLRNSFERAVIGFQCEATALGEHNAPPESGARSSVETSPDGLKELLSEASWPYTQRGANDFSAELEAESARRACLRTNERDLEANVELFRSRTPTNAVQRALATFLLSASGALCMVRAYSQPVEGEELYGLQVSLAKAPAPEEVQDALGALSIAYRMCAREANVLLTDAAAQCYIAARRILAVNQPGDEEE